MLADATGQHFTRISRIENGAQPPTDRNIQDWCGACGAEDQIPVSVAVIPASIQRRAIATIGFWIFDDNAVALETPTAAIKITRPNEIAQYAAMFGHLHHEAVHGQQARQLIAATLAGL